MPDRADTDPDIKALKAAVALTPYENRAALARRLERLAARLRAGQPSDRSAAALAADIAEAAGRAQRRRDAAVRLSFADELPVSAHVDEIRAALDRHQALVVCGETGSGKTTQLPKICLAAGRGVFGVIGHTQPRRMAARSIAARLAVETATAPGQVIGYQVRFDDRTGPDCRVKLMTDGILLNELTRDRRLLRYDTLIIDEAHERSLNIDFLLGYLKTLLPTRPELRLIVTSATIDPERFSRHFDNAPVIEVSGRTFPVEVRYRPPGEGEPAEAIVAAVDELGAEGGQGDTLVFLAGEREIRETGEALRKHHPPGTEILPLFARLSAADQDRVFAPAGKRRIILATNVAETSLTVPGITAVVDPGLARISRYSYRSKIQRLPVEPVSQASANQRAGRCGRTSDGICIRLYDQEDYEARPPFTDPEILRTSLASVILSMSHLKLGDVESFPFVQPPDVRFVRDGYRLLAELEAVDEARRITPAGRQLARLPVDPRIARMIVAAPEHGCLDEVLIVAAGLSIRDPRERPQDKRKAADLAHAAFADEQSDFIAWLNLWRAWLDRSRHLSGRKLRGWCREQFLSFQRMREWQDIHRQLRKIASDLGLKRANEPAGYEALHRALLCGLAGHVGRHDEKGEYLGARNTRFRINLGSGLAGRTPRWVIAAELVHTRRVYARTVAAVKPAWIEQTARHLLTRSLYDPHWSAARGRAEGFERVSLYGLELRARRRVGLAGTDLAEARAIFIEEALVNGNARLSGPWRKHNTALIRRLRRDENKLRRLGGLVDEGAVRAFYEARVPADVASVKAFEAWRRRVEQTEPDALFLTARDAGAGDAGASLADSFPDTFELDGNALSLEYRFDLTDPADGVTLVLPRALLAQLRPEAAEWLVPGLREEKIAAIVRGLPKSVRRRFVPVPDFARAFLAGFADGPPADSLYVALADAMSEGGVAVGADTLRAVPLPDHLRLNVRVVDDDGATLAEGRELDQLGTVLGRETGSVRGPASAGANDGGSGRRITDWDFGELPESVTLRQNDLKLVRYPALADRGDAVERVLCDTPLQAGELNRDGVARLLLARLPQQARYIRRRLLDRNETALLCHGLCDIDELTSSLLTAAVRATFPLEPVPRNAGEFTRLLDGGRGDLVARAGELAGLTVRILKQRRKIVSQLRGGRLPPASASDIRDHLARLLPADFLAITPGEQLAQMPRYLDAIDRRLERLQRGAGTDSAAMAGLAPHEQKYQDALARGVDPAALADYRWLLEEFRVSLFAQHLGTRVPVSPARLERLWDRIAADLARG